MIYEDKLRMILWPLAVAALFTGSCLRTIAQSGASLGPDDPISGSIAMDLPALDSRNATITQLLREKRWNTLASVSEQDTHINPADPNPFYWLGISRFQLRDPVGATQAFRSAEKLGLNSAKFHEALGLAYYDLNQFYLFEQQMEAASRLDPKDFAPKYYLALYRLSVKSDVSGALKLLTEATELNPTDWRSLYQEGYCLELSGDLTQASAFYARAISEVEKNHEPFGWPFQGMARLLAIDNPNDARQLAQQAVRIEPEQYAHHLELAKIYADTAELPGAIREAQAAEALSPNTAAIRYLLFRLYRRSGDAARAESELEVFHRLNSVYGPE
jgi:tetratricopeptide (TPR) repeat protein